MLLFLDQFRIGVLRGFKGGIILLFLIGLRIAVSVTSSTGPSCDDECDGACD